MVQSQKRELRESGLFRRKVLDRFLNGMEPDAPLMLSAWPWKTLAGAVFLSACVAGVWLMGL